MAAGAGAGTRAATLCLVPSPTPAPMLRSLLLLTLVASTAAAQPRALTLPPEYGRTYTDAVHVIGWSPDGRTLAVLYRSSGQGAVADRLSLHVQDLATDARVADLRLTSQEPEEEPDVPQIWRDQGPAIRRTLAAHRIGSSGASLRALPLRGRGGPYSVAVTTTPAADGAVAGYTLTMRNGRGQAKTLEMQSFDYPTSGVRTVGVLVAPTGDRVAVVLAIGAPGYENAPTVRYRMVGAGIGARF